MRTSGQGLEIGIICLDSISWPLASLLDLLSVNTAGRIRFFGAKHLVDR